MKNIIKNVLESFLPLFIGMMITSISLAILQPYMATKNQIYKDIIIENTALMGTNKSGELFSFWLSMFLGILSIIISYVIFKKNMDTKKKQNIKLDFLGIGIFLLPIIFLLILKQEINFLYFLLAVTYALLCIFMKKDKNYRNKVMMLIIILYYFNLMLKIVIDKLLKTVEIYPKDAIYLGTFILVIIILHLLKKRKIYDINQLILLFQIPLPLILLIHLTNNYLLNNEIYKISYPKRYKLLILLILLILFGINIFQYRKKMKELKKQKNMQLVMLTTVVIIFLVRHYVTPMYVHYGDFWHFGENVLPWDQLINKHQILYKEYSGTSGLYGLVFGFFQNIIFHGLTLSYLPTVALTNLFWFSLFAILCYYHVKDFSLIISLLVTIPGYNRVYLMLVCILILMNKKLMKKRIIWVQTYFILSAISILYYPLIGVGLMLGGIPFTIIQLYLIFKERKNYNELKLKLFWILNFILFLLVVVFFKYGLGLIITMKSFSSQTVLADGIIAYQNPNIPLWFMSYISNTNIKKELWYIFLFSIIILVVLIHVFLLLLNLFQNKTMLDKLKSPSFFTLSSSCVTILISYTYFVVRMDPETNFFERTTSIIVIFLGIILPIYLYRYGRNLFNRSIQIFLISLCISIVILVQEKSTFGKTFKEERQEFGQEVKNIYRVYEIKDLEYIDGEKIGILKLGKGFMPKSTIDFLISYRDIMNKLNFNSEKEYFWPVLSRELISIFNTKVPTKFDSPYLTKDLKSTRENLLSMKEKPVFISQITETGLSYNSYYTFRWITDNNYISYNGFWIRPDRYEKIFGNTEEAKKVMIENYPILEMKKMPYSLGNSMNTLNNIFINKKEVDLRKIKIETGQGIVLENNKVKMNGNENASILVTLPEKIQGNDYDFIYLELKKEYKKGDENIIQIFWEAENLGISENRSISLIDMNGKLLIPIGMHLSWIYSNNVNKLKINFVNLNSDTEIKIKKIDFMKLDRNRK